MGSPVEESAAKQAALVDSVSSVHTEDEDDTGIDDPAEMADLDATSAARDADEGSEHTGDITEKEQEGQARDMQDESSVRTEMNTTDSQSQEGEFAPDPDAARPVTKLPISKIKKIMKFDPEVSLANQDAVFLVAKATELFIEGLSKHAGVYTTRGKRKTVQKRDVEFAVDSVPNFAFLDGVMETL